jgi:hypothetical protein
MFLLPFFFLLFWLLMNLVGWICTERFVIFWTFWHTNMLSDAPPPPNSPPSGAIMSARHEYYCAGKFLFFFLSNRREISTMGLNWKRKANKQQPKKHVNPFFFSYFLCGMCVFLRHDFSSIIIIFLNSISVASIKRRVQNEYGMK